MGLNSYSKNSFPHSRPITSFPPLVVGDFKIHHHLADQIRKHNFSELKPSFPYFPRAAEHGHTILYTSGVHTLFLLQGLSRPSVLDLSFQSSSLMPFFQEWITDLASTGSNHVPITIRMGHTITAPGPWPQTGSDLIVLALSRLFKNPKFPPS